MKQQSFQYTVLYLLNSKVNYCDLMILQVRDIYSSSFVKSRVIIEKKNAIIMLEPVDVARHWFTVDLNQPKQFQNFYSA
jgi:hypothetical protein